MTLQTEGVSMNRSAYGMATDFGRCLMARATHASHRAILRCLGLSVGIAIALSGCASPEEVRREQVRREQRDAYVYCIYDATGPFGSASIEIVNDCRKRTGWQQ